MFMTCLVRNINGTSKRKPKGFISWQAFWEEKKGEEFMVCSNKECWHLAEVGAHVQRIGYRTSNEWYIVPLCRGCNNKSIEFEVLKADLIKVVG